MRPQGHIAAGYLVSQAVIGLMAAPAEEQLALTILGIAAGIFPDLDVLYYFARKKKLIFDDDFVHHHWVSHTFPPYFLAALLFYLARPANAAAAFLHAGITAFSSVIVHLLLDMVGSGDGIMIAWPFSRRMVGIGKLNARGMQWKRLYEASPYVRIEYFIILSALFHIFGKLLANT